MMPAFGGEAIHIMRAVSFVVRRDPSLEAGQFRVLGEVVLTGSDPADPAVERMAYDAFRAASAQIVGRLKATPAASRAS